MTGISVLMRDLVPPGRGVSSDPRTRVILSNINAMLTNVHSVGELPGDILLLTEVKLTAEAQRQMGCELRDAGWEMIWGEPQQPMQAAPGVNESDHNAERGGTAAAVRLGAKGSRRPLTGRAREYELEGRLMHAEIPYGDARQTADYLIVYGYQGAWMGGEAFELNEDF